VHLYYLEDLQLGQRFVSESTCLSREEILAFAERYDPQPFHLEDAAAEASLFGGLAASGWHTAALTMRMLVQGGLPLAGGLVGMQMSTSWPTPTRPTDTLHVESEVLDIVRSRSRPEQGIVTVRSETKDLSGEVRQVLTANLMVQARTPNAVNS
jgi:acyl dehydratase